VNCPIGAEPWSTCPKDRTECCAAICPYYHPERHNKAIEEEKAQKHETRMNLIAWGFPVPKGLWGA
jgi:hypothetical protein